MQWSHTRPLREQIEIDEAGSDVGVIVVFTTQVILNELLVLLAFRL